MLALEFCLKAVQAITAPSSFLQGSVFLAVCRSQHGSLKTTSLPLIFSATVVNLRIWTIKAKLEDKRLLFVSTKKKSSVYLKVLFFQIWNVWAHSEWFDGKILILLNKSYLKWTTSLKKHLNDLEIWCRFEQNVTCLPRYFHGGIIPIIMKHAKPSLMPSSSLHGDVRVDLFRLRFEDNPQHALIQSNIGSKPDMHIVQKTSGVELKSNSDSQPAALRNGLKITQHIGE